jgi:hypothetical protein
MEILGRQEIPPVSLGPLVGICSKQSEWQWAVAVDPGPLKASVATRDLGLSGMGFRSWGSG